MASGIAMSDLADLVNTTLPHMPEPRLHHTQELQAYEALDRWFQEDRVEVQGGDQIEERITLSETGQARMVRPYQKDELTVSDVVHVITAPWRSANTHYVIEKSELLANRQPEQIVDLLKVRRADALQSMANLLEPQAWGKPSSGSDDLTAYGIDYWVPQMDSSSAGLGFYGGSNISAGNAVGGITPGGSNDNKQNISGGEPRWRSFCAGGEDSVNDKEWYMEINKAAIRTMRLMFYALNFKAPFTVQELVEGYKSNFRIYTSTWTKVELEEYAESNNDQLGNDLAPFADRTAFKRIPIIDVSYLNKKPYKDTKPIYFINHAHFVPYVRAGAYFAEDEAIRVPEHHKLLQVHVDLEFNYVCNNRRHQGCMAITTDTDVGGDDAENLT